MKRLLFTATFLISLSAIAETDSYGAIAFSPSTGRIALSWMQKDQVDAESVAKSFCKESDCRALISASNNYLSIAVGVHSHVFVGKGLSGPEAQQKAIGPALKADGALRTFTYFRTDRDDDQTSPGGRILYVGGQAWLEDIGGVFNYEIPSFVGFKQQQNEWCWAAAAETVYYAMTGAHLDQSQIARIQTTASDDDPPELGFEKYVVSQTSCDATNAANMPCNHPDDPAVVLAEVGASLPPVQFPKTNDMAVAYQMLRKSLINNVPVIVGVYNPGAIGFHAVVVYGANFSASSMGSKRARITLKLFDPMDGRTYVTKDNRYTPPYDGSFQEWHGITAFGDFQSPQARIVNTKACQFLTNDDRSQYCK